MLTNDNEFGAPWNDQYYIVTVKDINRKSWNETLVLDGPYDYDDYDILVRAQGMFPEYEIIDIKPYEICR